MRMLFDDAKIQKSSDMHKKVANNLFCAYPRPGIVVTGQEQRYKQYRIPY